VTPNAGDILIFDGSDIGGGAGSAVTVTAVPYETNAKLTVQNNSLNVTLSTSPATSGAGTLARAGTAVTGTGTSFNTFFVVGDFLFTGASANMSQISAIASATGLTTVESGTITAGTTYSRAAQLRLTSATNALSVASGSTLTLGSSAPLVIKVETGATATISGAISATTASQRLISTDAAGITFLSGSSYSETGAMSGNPFGALATVTNNNVVFASGSLFTQATGSNPFGAAQPASVASFQSGSLYKVTANLAPSLSGRTYTNLEIAAAGFSQSATGGGLLTIENLTITTGVLNLNLTGGINIKGNISVAASQTLTFTPASANTLTLNGTTPQSINGSGTLTFGPNLNLAINNPAGITLNKPVTLGSAGTLTLTNGLVNTTLTNLFTYTGPGAGGGGSVSSHINGPMARTGSTDYTWPIGNATLYRPISVTSLSGSATITASYTEANPITTFGVSLQLSINHISSCEYWELDDGPSTVTGKVGLQFAGASTCGGPNYVNDPASLLVAHWNGVSFWDDLGVAFVPPPTTTSVTAAAASTFSPFTVGSSSPFNPLPISLFSFSGYKDGSRNQLRWTTNTELNNRGFEIQRSTDGVNYSAIGFVNSQALGGNSVSQLNYTFTDNNVTGSRQYYRLRQVDFDNQSKLSSIVLIKGDKLVSLTIDGLFPNPASTSVNVMIATPNKDKVTLVVTDIAGKSVIQQLVNAETGSNTIPVDISRLSNGIYMVKLICSSNCESTVGKFVKQ
jgi:hypothetical protein